MHKICAQPVCNDGISQGTTRGGIYTPTLFNWSVLLVSAENSRVMLSFMRSFTQQLSIAFCHRPYLLFAYFFTVSTAPIISTKR